MTDKNRIPMMGSTMLAALNQQGYVESSVGTSFEILTTGGLELRAKRLSCLSRNEAFIQIDAGPNTESADVSMQHIVMVGIVADEPDSLAAGLIHRRGFDSPSS